MGTSDAELLHEATAARFLCIALIAFRASLYNTELAKLIRRDTKLLEAP